MCAIVGLKAGEPRIQGAKYWHNVRELFSHMLQCAEGRGSAATGLFVINSAGSGRAKPTVSVLKAPVKASELIRSKEYRTILNKIGPTTLSVVGHTRNATDGNPLNNRNNHPHHHGRFIGVHNGVFHNHEDVWKAFSESLKRQSNCDSEAIFALMDHFYEYYNTTEEVLEAALNELEGWQALAFANLSRPENLYLTRDETTPLEITRLNGPELTLFSTLFSYAQEALGNSPIKGEVEKLSIKDNSLITIDVRGRPYQRKLSNYKRKYGGGSNRNLEELRAITSGRASGITS